MVTLESMTGEYDVKAIVSFYHENLRETQRVLSGVWLNSSVVGEAIGTVIIEDFTVDGNKMANVHLHVMHAHRNKTVVSEVIRCLRDDFTEYLKQNGYISVHANCPLNHPVAKIMRECGMQTQDMTMGTLVL
jgi:hypothetical protein